MTTGIGRYTISVLRGLQETKNQFFVTALTSAQQLHLLEPLCDEVKAVSSGIYTLREQIEIAWAARGADLLHVPHYNAPLLFPGSLLVTIHDLIHLLDAGFKRRAASFLYARPMFALVCRKARHIIAVSKFTKATLVERLGIPPAKISVIYEGVDSAFQPLEKQSAFIRVKGVLGLQRPYFFFIGNLKPHKNLHVLIRAFSLLRQRVSRNLLLVLVGQGRECEKALLEESGRLGIFEDVVFVPTVDNVILPSLYSAAELFVMPSRIEGFGLPVLEAMACGTPVVCSRAASLPEVAGDAAEYFEPSSADDLAAAIERVLESTELQECLRRKGLERVKLFSWDECARRHAEIYRQMLQ